MILLSTSAVLDCQAPRMTADRPRNPSSIYGRSKAEAEQAFMQLGTSASILRLSKVLVPGMERFNKWIQTLKRGNQIDCPDDLRFSPITIDQAVDGLVAISDQREGGLFQLSGDSDISYAEAARFIARKVGVTDRLVRAHAAAELGIPAESVTAYTSLDTSRLNALYGFVAPAPLTVINQILESAPAPSSAGRFRPTQI